MNTGEATKFINLGVIFNQQGEVLMIRRQVEEVGAGGAILRWAFPGGNPIVTESRQDCVRRKVLAETGYDIKYIRQISLRKHPQIDIWIAYHLCRLISKDPIAEPSEPHEVAEIRWVKPTEVENIKTTHLDPKVKQVLENPSFQK